MLCFYFFLLKLLNPFAKILCLNLQFVKHHSLFYMKKIFLALLIILSEKKGIFFSGQVILKTNFVFRFLINPFKLHDT